jgi:hypothetical protein
MRPSARTTVAGIAVLGISLQLALVGCDGSGEASVVAVRGKVVLDGQPLKFGSVTLQPTRGQPAQGDIDPQGEFVLSTYRQGDGAAVGRHKVKVTCYSSQDPAAKRSSANGNESLGVSLIPERYTRFDTSGLEVAILAGGIKPYTIELRSEPAGEIPATGGLSSEEKAAAEDREIAEPAKHQDKVGE